jgi:hypothetical protein
MCRFRWLAPLVHAAMPVLWPATGARGIECSDDRKKDRGAAWGSFGMSFSLQTLNPYCLLFTVGGLHWQAFAGLDAKSHRSHGDVLHRLLELVLDECQAKPGGVREQAALLQRLGDVKYNDHGRLKVLEACGLALLPRMQGLGHQQGAAQAFLRSISPCLGPSLVAHPNLASQYPKPCFLIKPPLPLSFLPHPHRNRPSP